MVTLQKQGDRYGVSHGRNQLGIVELYSNTNHMSNCYVELDMKYLVKNVRTEMFGKLKEIAGRPLQAMVESDDVAMVEFLFAGGFVCKRKCYEVEVCAEDYIGGSSDMQLCCCSAGTPDYDH